ncbi:MAG TPA: pilus assembly PilX N-terminal domain-containing protein [Gammaproteobacteria bacterium]
MQTRRPPVQSVERQKGAALVVGLVLLMVLTILGISGMNTATLELTMASNAQFQQDAFQAAETGIDIAISSAQLGNAINGQNIVVPPTTLGDGVSTAESITTFELATPVPDRAFSLGEGSTGSVQAYHFDVVATGMGPRNATSTHTQSFYVIGPGGL